MYKDTVTVFNRYRSEQLGAVTWYPHVLKNVEVQIDKAANIAKTGLENADVAKLHVKYRVLDGDCMVGDLKYLRPKEWDAQPNDMYEETITFNEGVDFFWVGEWTKGVVNDDDYHMGTLNGFSDYMNREHDEVYSITSVGMYKTIPHFEIGGA